jgi:hypothetical protein
MKTQLLEVRQLGQHDRTLMYELLNTYFTGVSPEGFGVDLAKKHWVILLWDELTGLLQGFTTLRVDQFEWDGELINVVSSGDTIVDPEAWGSSALPKAWVRAIQHIQQVVPPGRFYWLLICSGYRTYRFLPVFAQNFYPRYDRLMPWREAALLDCFATARYTHDYDSAKGIVRFPQPQRLRSGLSGIPVGRLSDPHIAFFDRINPGHDNGDELVCLTEICEANLTAAGRRIWSQSSSSVLVEA